MTGYPIYYLGLLLFGLWYRARPRYGLKTLFLFWWIGLILVRIAPAVILRLVQSPPETGSPSVLGFVLGLMMWVGGALCLRTLVGLALWNRPRNRRLWIWTAGLLIFLITGAFAYRGAGVLALSLVALPFLLSVRWRSECSALPLLLANVTAILTIIISSVQFSDPWSVAAWTSRGSIILGREMTVLGILYSFFVLPTTATRIHLQIRRIGARLVSSHLLAGLIPAGLLVLFILLGTTLYLSTYRGTMAVRTLKEASRTGVVHMVREVEGTGAVTENPLPGGEAGGILILRNGNGPARILQGSPAFAPDSLLAADVSSEETPLLFDGNTLFLRARLDTSIGGSPVRIEALSPVDSLRMVEVSRIVGVPVRINPRLQVSRSRGGVSVSGDVGLDDQDEETSEAPAQETILPEGTALLGDTTLPGAAAEKHSEGRAIGPPNEGKKLPGGATISCLKLRKGGWAPSTIVITSAAAFGEQILSLFSISRDNPMATIVLIVLGFIALFFLGAIWVTSAMVLTMGRSVAQSVGALSEATDALREGKLKHRIAIKGNDELWEVASSFNVMAEGLEKMREMELESQRLEEELRLARAIQTRLLPAHAPLLERAELAGLSIPAREVGGDYFDYLILEGGLIGIAVADVSGKGAPAAMLMSSFRASLRSQDLQLLGPAEVLGRINRFIHASVDTGKFITAFLGLLDPATGEFRYANAGHDAPLVVGSDGNVSELTGGGLILGLLPQIVYDEAVAQLPLGSLVAIFTDGITEARDPSGEFYGSERLLETLKSSGSVPCDDLLQRVVQSIQDFSASGPQSDDITLVLVRRR